MKKLLVLSCFLLAPGLRAEISADSSVGFEVDVAQFRANDSLNIAEIYLSVPRSGFTFVQRDTVWQADIQYEVAVIQDHETVFSKSWNTHSYAGSRADVSPAQRLIDEMRIQIRRGRYQVKVSVHDLNGSKVAQKAVDLEVEPFEHDALLLSDIQIAAEIKKSRSAGKFYKNGYRVIPNPATVITGASPMLLTYFEIYNLTFPSDSTYSVTYRLLNAAGDTVKAYAPKAKPIVGASLVEVGGINTVTLATGKYFLDVAVRDKTTGKAISKKRAFYVYHRDAPPEKSAGSTQLSTILAFYDSKPEPELDREFDQAKWIATDQERELYTQLDPEGKRQFLARFWLRRDPRPETIFNEFREDYLNRVRYAAKHFGQFHPGWNTDRGRVLLVYGKPDEIERFPNTSDMRNYEIWHYYQLEGGVQFYFVPVSKFGDLELVHSTARNELKDADWRRRLRIIR